MEVLGGEVLGNLLDRVAHNDEAALDPENLREILVASLAEYDTGALTEVEFHRAVRILRDQQSEQDLSLMTQLDRIEAALASLVSASSDSVSDTKTDFLRSRAVHQLPSDISDFVGRGTQLAEILAAFDVEGDVRETPLTIVVLTGMAGVGKSALAVRAAHRLKDRFPDTQIYLDLRGADSEILDSSIALEVILRSLGLQDQQIPTELQERRVSSARSSLIPGHS